MKKILLVLLALAVIGGGFWAWSVYRQPKITAKEFAGTIQSVEGNTLLVKGAYLSLEHPELSRPDQQQDVRIMVTADTRLIYTAYYRPTPEEIAKNPGPYIVRDLKHEQKDGALADLVPGREIQVFAEANIYQEKQFTAQRIEYLDITSQ